MVASCAEEHIYDTVVFAKSSKSTVSPSHLYTPQPSLNAAAEYEVPVTRHSLLTNGHHHQKQQEQKVDQEQQEISDNQEQ